MKKVVLALLLFVTSIVMYGCGEKTESTNASADNKASGSKVVKLGYPSAGSDFLGGLAGVAQDKGYFKEELEKIGYTIEYKPFVGAGPAVNDAFVTKDINFVIYADFPGIVLKSKGIDLDLLGITSEKINAQILVKEDSNIKSLKDLKGKKIGFPKGTYVQKYLIEALASVGITTKDVELINMTSDAQTGLLTGSVDALAYVDAVTQRLISSEKNLKVISSTNDNKEWGGNSIFAGSSSYLKENPEVGSAMIKALLKAKEDIQKSPEDFYNLAAKREQMPVDAVKASYNLDGGKFDYMSVDITESSLKKLDSAKQFLLKNKLISDDFDVYKWADNSHYKKALAETEK